VTTPKLHKTTGSHFYRYSSAEHAEWLKTIIIDHELYIPSVKELNDPADGRPRLASMSEDKMVSFLLKNLIKREPWLSVQTLEKELVTVRHNIRKYGTQWSLREMTRLLNTHMEEFRIYSLSKRFDNLSLWAKYAAGSSGYCLEFASEGPLFKQAVEVIYRKCRPVDINDPKAFFLAYKAPEWSNEEEVRLIAPRGSSSKIKIDPRWLTRLILGTQMSNANEKMIREWAKQRQPELTVAKAYFDELRQQLRLR